MYLATTLQQRPVDRESQLVGLYRARARVALAKARIAVERGAVGIARLHLAEARTLRLNAHMVERRACPRYQGE